MRHRGRSASEWLHRGVIGRRVANARLNLRGLSNGRGSRRGAVRLPMSVARSMALDRCRRRTGSLGAAPVSMLQISRTQTGRNVALAGFWAFGFAFRGNLEFCLALGTIARFACQKRLDVQAFVARRAVKLDSHKRAIVRRKQSAAIPPRQRKAKDATRHEIPGAAPHRKIQWP